MRYEIISSAFIGTQRVVRVKNMETGETIDFTPDTLESNKFPADLQQYIESQMYMINSGETDYDGMLM
ncbi:hypothetical protein [Bacillus sp. 165]|uniref:hypothetical protein n=1 Tax=Bacillus sp. 165 TaxID=1529117 RepID=UPI001ADC56EA|nr:hypothetical protein [Bacillus sp. 165]MBO9129071.1 hypothetical protein [Bacillus sp. 165]